MKWGVYLYDATKPAKGYRGTDYSDYLLQGLENDEDLTEELDTTQITLAGLDKKEAFIPSTKFWLVPFDDNGDEVEDRILCRVVQNDAVSKPILDNDAYFNHAISLIEPSALAQHRVVDNIATTYKLKDVTLSKELPTTIVPEPNESYATLPNSIVFGYNSNTGIHATGKYFKYRTKMALCPYGQSIINAKDYYLFRDINDFPEDPQTHIRQATIRLPELCVHNCLVDTKDYYYMPLPVSYRATIKDYDEAGGLSQTYTYDIIENTNLSSLPQYLNYFDEATPMQVPLYLTDSFIEDYTITAYPQNVYSGVYTARKYTNTSASDPTYSYSFPVFSGHNYEVSLRLIDADGNYFEPNNYIYASISGGVIKQQQPDSGYIYEAIFQIEELGEDEIIQSGTPYSVYHLISKALANSKTHAKSGDIPAGSVNHKTSGVFDYPCSFYIDEEFVNELKTTSVIENFYSEKNLWEILIEAGYYIHAIPEIVFGDNDKFKITFSRLGLTEENESGATQTTVENFRGIDDYIAETSSYVDNFIQLGGVVTEIVPAKSSSDDFLVSNEDCEIIVSKPIIELVGLDIRCEQDWYFNGTIFPSGHNAGTWASQMSLNNPLNDATQYVFEESIYKLLDVIPIIFPNKGVSLYYTNGDNKIKGLSYQLPRANIDAYTEYSIKKLIWSVFNGSRYSDSGWGANSPAKDIKINDFVFKVTYRTKDSARVSHIRPDLRKYLLNSAFDTVPQHQQFNNQQNVLLDSDKFGMNMYGALIKTGNLNYTVTEWCSDWSKVKKKGYITRINGDIYYASKIKNVCFVNHIVSTVEYSKDYNQLSKVIGIPSEPRFYEISERSNVRREVLIPDYLLFDPRANDVTNDIKQTRFWKKLGDIKELILGNASGKTPFLNSVVTTFHGDENLSGDDVGTFGVKEFRADIYSFLNAYTSGTTLVYEWDMADNFSAGDQNITPEIGEQISATDRAYRSLRAVPYSDKYGKAALFDFYMLNDAERFTNTSADHYYIEAEVLNMPESPISTADGGENLARSGITHATNYGGGSLVLLKDSREALSFNYNMQMISSTDQIVFSRFLLEQDKKIEHIKLVLLSTELNKLSDGKFKSVDKLAETSIVLDYTNERVRVDFSTFVNNAEFNNLFENDKAKQSFAIAVSWEYESPSPARIPFIFGRNIPKGADKADALKNIYIFTPRDEYIFTKQNHSV